MVSGMEWLLADQVICRDLTEVTGPSVMCGEKKLTPFVSSLYLYVLSDCGKCISMKEDVISVISLPVLLKNLDTLIILPTKMYAVAGLLKTSW